MSDAKIPELDAPEKLLKLLATFNSLVKNVFSTDLNANIQPDDPQALHAGILGDLASQATRIPEDVDTVVDFIQTAKNGGLNNDKDYLVRAVLPDVQYA